MKTTLKIHFADDNGTIAPLFHQYPTQTNPQPAYLEFEPDDDSEEPLLTAGYNAEIGNGIPANVFNRKILRWSIPSSAHRQSLMELSEHEPLIDTLNAIRAGYDCDPYIGGSYTEEASEAINTVQCILDDFVDSACVWLADEWIGQDSIDLVELIKAGSVEAYAKLCEPQDADHVIFGDMEQSVAKQIEDHLDRLDEEDYSERDKQAAEILRKYQEAE